MRACMDGCVRASVRASVQLSKRVRVRVRVRVCGMTWRAGPPHKSGPCLHGRSQARKGRAGQGTGREGAFDLPLRWLRWGHQPLCRTRMLIPLRVPWETHNTR